MKISGDVGLFPSCFHVVLLCSDEWKWSADSVTFVYRDIEGGHGRPLSV